MTYDASDQPPITRDEMLPLFVAAVPSFLPSWHAFLSDWNDEPQLPLYLALGDFARHLVEQLSRGDIAHFPLVFGIVERCQEHGDLYVQEAVTIGLLEELQNLNLHMTTAPSDFEVWLGPRSKALWEGLNQFWAGKAPYVRGE